MRKLALTLVAVLSLAIAPAAAGATLDVSITQGGFVPDSITVASGDTVTWTNKDASARQVAANSGAFTSPVLATGQSYSFTFTSAGNFMYRDEFAKKLKGTAEVTQGATVTIATAKRAVVFGRSTLLSGQVSSRAAGETVTILATATGGSAPKQFAALTTTDGAWSLAVKPKIRTSYQAHWNAATSAQTVTVHPRVGFTIRSGVFITRVTPARPGKTVFLQRWSVSLKQWISVKKVVLNKRSRARFRWKPKAADYKLRVFMPRKQAGAGYLAGESRARIFVRS